MSVLAAEAASSTPFELVLGQIAPLRLRLSLRNISKQPQLFLHDTLIQPSRLLLAGVEPQDDRAIEKFNNAAPLEMFHTLAPGKTVELISAQFEKRDGAWRIHWGPFQFNNLRPGTHSVGAEWYAARRPDAAPASTAIWKGKVTSNRLSVTLSR